jgi:hypothetical protein
MYDVEDWILYYELFNFSGKSIIVLTMYLYLTYSISYSVNLYLDLRNVNKFNSIQFSSVRSNRTEGVMCSIPNYEIYIPCENLESVDFWSSVSECYTPQLPTRKFVSTSSMKG